MTKMTLREKILGRVIGFNPDFESFEELTDTIISAITEALPKAGTVIEVPKGYKIKDYGDGYFRCLKDFKEILK